MINRYTKAQKKRYIKRLRKNQTRAERALVLLYLIGFRAQQEDATGFVPDYYNRVARVAIELDGGIHKRPDVKARDKYKDKARRKHGIYTIRVRNWRAEKLTVTVLIEALITSCIWYLYRSTKL